MELKGQGETSSEPRAERKMRIHSMELKVYAYDGDGDEVVIVRRIHSMELKDKALSLGGSD